MGENKVLWAKYEMKMKLMQSAYDLAQEISHKKEITTSDKRRFLSRYKDLEKLRAEVDDVYTAILCGKTPLDDERREVLEKYYVTFTDMYYSLQVTHSSLFEENSAAASASSNQVTSKASEIECCLPKLSLQRFTGSHMDWPNFIAVFNSVVHENQRLSQVQKLHYLLSVLDKEPLSLVRHLLITSANYKVAYDLLTERYENKRLIADKYVEAILNLPNLSQINFKTLNSFINTLKENVQALKALSFEVESWSFLLLHIILRKLNIDLRSKFEQIVDSQEIPTFKQLLKFLENQLRILENIGSSIVKPVPRSVNVVNSELKVSSFTCLCCGEGHMIYFCNKFEAMTPEQRKQFVIQHKLCFNCLRTHHISKCNSRSVCQVCRGRHHTKLHLPNLPCKSATTDNADEVAVSTLSSTVQPQSLHGADNRSTMVLGTAVVRVQDISGHHQLARALIDSGSQVSIITENLAQLLGLPRSQSGAVLGLGASSTQQTRGIVTCNISPLKASTRSLSTDCVIMSHITGPLPSVPVSSTAVQLCNNLVLADKHFMVPGQIDMLLGIDLYDQILDGRKFSLGDNMPTAYSSIFGWIIMGRAPSSTLQSNHSMSCMHTRTLNLDLALTRFWEAEEPPRQPIQDPEDVQCEKHFIETHSRDSSGRFIVHLPFKVEHKPLGDTYTTALKRFYNLERRLLKEPRLRELYIDFMRDYLEAGHMREVESPISSERYYIPHHGVLREHSSTTKLRAVFDASSPSSTGVSLNQVLMSGPKLQKNIEDIILRFRIHPVVFTCDIKQMYRQLLMAVEHCKYQTIFWRESPEEKIRQYELLTVVYGITSSAFQAIRVIHELANLNSSQHPEASRVLLEDTFVDDVVSGSRDLDSALALQKELVEILSQGGLVLRKWSSNSKFFLEAQTAEHCEQPYRFEGDGDNVFKVLGIEWKSNSDSFIYRVSNMKDVMTKRGVLSNIARLYDPCGFLAPVTFYAKQIMQMLWSVKCAWDETLPDDVQVLWSKFISEFNQLDQVSIPRWLLTNELVDCQLHGFSDASERGYAACVYLRVEGLHSDTSVRLLSAKSRVAPLKQKLTIPKLELSGAHLLARLLEHVFGILQGKIQISSTVAWSDSSIVLSWLKISPHKLQTYEGNRVSQIQALVPRATWKHVPSAFNPADSASRGLTPSELVNHPLWWSPPWLEAPASTWPGDIFTISEGDLPGIKTSPLVSNVVEVSAELPALTRFSSFAKLQAVMAWCKRFVHNSRLPSQRRTGPLSVSELNVSLLLIVKSVQYTEFSDTIQLLSKNKALKGSIRRLNPFLDPSGHLRVGGRLVHSSLEYGVKHPLLLPKSHHVTQLIVDHYHRLFLHPGLMASISLLQRKFWILSARRVIRQQIFKCQQCYRLRPKTLEPFMGDLPSHRVTSTSCRAYQKVGLDFAGPFMLKTSRIRNAKSYKAYLCIFVCFTTKCVHLEIVSELSTEAFLACFDRFVSRRGLPSDVFSDCGTNLVGARNHLKDVYQHVQSSDAEIRKALVSRQVVWHLNSPSNPHMGGLWESAVKSAKTILKRVVGDRSLLFEELATVFAKVEAALNSRPLCPVSNDPNDFEVLTPGHFIIGQPLQALPEQDLEEIKSNLLKRWQALRQINQHFWKRWHSEYLHTLQQRPKWLTKIANLQVGDLVLIKDSNLPPLFWKKARVAGIRPGEDGTVRVVELTTQNGPLLRPAVKLVPLLPCQGHDIKETSL